jgi:hypothetical protein
LSVMAGRPGGASEVAVVIVASVEFT